MPRFALKVLQHPGRDNKLARPIFLFIFVTVLIDVLAFGMVLPVLPRIVAELTHGDAKATANWIGILGTTFALTQFIFSPLLGCLSDRFGRRPVVLLSNLGVGLNFFVMALANSLPLMLLGRLLCGATASSFGTAYAYIADVTSKSERVHAYGTLGAAFGVGFVIGPALGGALGEIDARLPFWAAGLLAVLNFLYGVLILPESLPLHKRSAAIEWRQLSPLGSLRALGRGSPVLGLAAVGFLTTFAQYVVPTLLVLYTYQRYQWDGRQVGLVLALIGLCGAVVQAGLAGRMVGRIGARASLLTAYVCSAASLGVFGLAPSGAWFLLGIPLWALAEVANPALQSLMSGCTMDSAQGRLQGGTKSLFSLAGVFAPLFFASAFASSVRGGAASGLPGLAFVLAAALMCMALALAAWVTRR